MSDAPRLETPAEAVRPGDRIFYFRRWLGVQRTQVTTCAGATVLALFCEDEETEAERLLLVQFGARLRAELVHAA